MNLKNSLSNADRSDRLISQISAGLAGWNIFLIFSIFNLIFITSFLKIFNITVFLKSLPGVIAIAVSSIAAVLMGLFLSNMYYQWIQKQKKLISRLLLTVLILLTILSAPSILTIVIYNSSI